ncbi:MAG: transglycosylase SLT domain-containing protein [Myxococcota bacterium]|jgi:soluble lytic murein transglycosylase|nr:transglycosylase SLT domain-containing protein [bacterium]MDP6075268.1 transglycosylase SLT domain-containing protein [Myxococcota bacterium]MDP6244087.1 transglycosylase SLT domain-containing protein [Myxococcota bacterium]MDP7431111.1 transglycosylase SLT domain-containing protein [Myxococcota bacterium]
MMGIKGWSLTTAVVVCFVSGALARLGPNDVQSGLSPVDRLLLAQPGRAFRHALDSIEAGETERSERLLVAIAARYPVIADHADFERLRLYALTGRLDAALALGEAWSHPDSPLGADVNAEVGRARAARGDEALARAAFERALSATQDGDRRAAILTELGRSHRRSGEPEQAAKRLLEVWVRYPLADLQGIDDDLDALEAELSRPLRDADQYRRRGDVLFGARHNEAALAAYERALERGELDTRGARRAKRQRARTLYRLRRYSEASEAFAALPQSPENRIGGASARARSGEVAEAAEELEKIAAQVRGGQGASAKLMAALLWDGEGEQERARALFASLAQGSGPKAATALWRLGWGAYLAGNYEAARQHLERLAERETGEVARLRARYWGARAAERLGDETAADAFGAIAREFPFSYYGWRASRRAAQGPSERPKWRLAPGEVALAAKDLDRPRILLEAGRTDAAHEALDRLYLRVGGVEDRLRLAALYAEAGDYHRPQRLVVGAYQETLARGPAREVIELWWHAWPAPYPEAVFGATEGRDVLDPELLYAVMREESGYRPEVRSVSGARGLLQLMPDTAERVARQEAFESFRVEDLFQPQVNIELGAAYLDQLLEQFRGRASAAIGSYNAGPHRVVEWLEDQPLDDDEWVEAIPYEQTRNYVKRVLRSVHAYQVLY